MQTDSRPRAEIAAEQLIAYIVDKELSHGDKLPNEYELAGLLGVGRSTVREAVKALCSRHVLEVRQGAGTFVVGEGAGISEDPLGFTFIKDKKKLVFDLLEIRLAMEPHIASMAALHASEEDAAELERLCREIELLIGRGEDHRDKDIAFHAKIAECSDNLVAPTLMPIIQRAISLFMDITNRSLREETIETHREITAAIRAGDPSAAADAMTLHIIYNRSLLRKLLTPHGE